MAVVPKQSSLKTLKKLIPLNLLSDADLEQLLKTATFKKDRAGSYLFRQGDTDYHNIYLLSGKVALLENSKEIDRVSADSETARFPLGHQIPRKNSARSVTRVEYVLIDNRKLSELLVRNKDDDYKVADMSSVISDDWMDQLLQSKVFQQIPPSNIQGVIMRMEEVDVKRGQKVVEQGGEGDYFYLIHKGRCKVTREEGEKEKATEIAKLGPGDSFGEEALLSNSPRNSTVTMLTNGKLLRLSKEDFIEFVKRPLAKGVSFEEADLLVSKGAVWLDVRMPSDYENGHLENSVSFPLDILRYQAPNLASDQSYVICCDDGHVSSTAAYLLTDRGFSVSVLEGGLRTVPAEMLIKEDIGSAGSRAKVINLRPGEDRADDVAVTTDQNELANLKAQLTEANNKIKDLGVKFKKYQEAQQKEGVKQKAEIKAQQAIIDKNKVRLDELKARREVDRKLIEQLQGESEEISTSLGESAQELNQAKETIADLESKLNVKHDSEQAIASERDEYKKQMHLYQEKLDAAIAERESVEVSLKETILQNEDVKKQAEALDKAGQQINQLNSDLVESRERFEQSQFELNELKRAAEDSDSEKQIEQLREELEQAQEKYKESQAELEELKSASEDESVNKQIEQLRNDLEQTQEKYSESQIELEEVKSALINKSADKQIEQLRVELEKAEDRFSDSQEELGKIREELQEKQAELERVSELSVRQNSEEIDTLRAEISTLTEALGEADLAYDQIREQAEEVSNERDQLLKKLRSFEREKATPSQSKLIDDTRTSIESEVFGDVYEDVVSKGLEVAEEEGLRQELEDLRKASKNWEQRVNAAEEKCKSLDDALEDRDKEIDRIKRELFEGKEKLAEEVEQRQQSEETVSQLRELTAQGLPANEYVDPRLVSSSQTLHMDDAIPNMPSSKSTLLWLFLGVGLCLVVLEALMIFSGKGELITGMLSDGAQTQGAPIAEESSISSALPQSIPQRADITPRTLPVKEQGAGNEELPWNVLKDIKFGPTMVKLNGGSFIMGSNRNQVSSDQWPAHEVEVPAFAISQTEVTFDDYDRFAQATGRILPNDQGWGRGKRPVINVSWEDAVAYTEWLSESTGAKYRLPTEAEWEFAIRGGSDSAYWWGYQVDEGRANCFDCGSEWDIKSTAPVASFSPNGFGLHDMAGNVREWVSDCYHPNYSGAPLDGSAWMERGCKERVVRGGAYNKTSDSMRSTWRGYLKPNLKFTFTGFRVVREL